jgi:hypothetical protein
MQNLLLRHVEKLEIPGFASWLSSLFPDRSERDEASDGQRSRAEMNLKGRSPCRFVELGIDGNLPLATDVFAVDEARRISMKPVTYVRHSSAKQTG